MWITFYCIVAVIVIFFLSMLMTRFALGINGTNLSDLGVCTAIGLSKKVNAILWSYYKDPGSTGTEMLSLQNAIEATPKKLLVKLNPFKFSLIVTWIDENRRSYAFKFEKLNCGSKIKLTILWVSARYLLYLDKKMKE